MKYQIRNSLVTFTNNSANITDVTGWEWFLDSGSGFVSLGTGSASQDIQFPDVAGVLCTVKLVAYGPWGHEVKFEEQYTTVESVPGPEILPISISDYSGKLVEILPELVPGTGAGEITWSLVGDAKGFEVELATGRIIGLLPPDLSSIVVKATDALGREAIQTVSLSASSVILHTMHTARSAANMTLDELNKVARLADIFGREDFGQVTGANQPTFVADDGFGMSCIEFSEDTHALVNSENVAGMQFSSVHAVLRLEEPAALGKLLCGFSFLSGSSYSSALICAAPGKFLYDGQGNIRNPAEHSFPYNFDISKKLILSAVFKEGTPTALFVNGVFRGLMDYADGSSSTCFVFGLNLKANVGMWNAIGNYPGSTAYMPHGDAPCARFKFYDLVTYYGGVGVPAADHTVLNSTISFLGRIHNINVKEITSDIWNNYVV